MRHQTTDALTTAHGRMLADGERLVPVVKAAELLGIVIGPRTAMRWSITGRHGIRLATVRAGDRRLRTTLSELRRWLAAVSEAEARLRGLGEPLPAIDDVASERILQAHGLGREGGSR